MTKAKWIWYRGDFECWHHMLLSSRRTELGCDYPCMWHLSRPEVNVNFFKSFSVPVETKITFVTHSRGLVNVAGKTFPVNTEVTVPAGEHRAEVRLFDLAAFPALFVDSEFLKTDESWEAEACDRRYLPADCDPAFYSPQDDPSVFPFCYSELAPVCTESINGGTLFDFGAETFGPVTVNAEKGDTVQLSFGESREEAIDFDNAIVHETLCGDYESRRPACAFRWVFVKSLSGKKISIKAEHEYLPIADKAAFRCDDELVEKIWKLCSDTFHLNTREFFLDGIKRDRWVWSGDAYQSFMVNRYLFDDEAITRRTVTALLGKPPYRTHINTINDYSAYLIISLRDHWFCSGDEEFVKKSYENIKLLFEFIVSRLDENGFVVPRHGDWIFIDWGVLDKTGALCAEQILLWETYNAMAKLASIAGEENDYSERAAVLREKIISFFWDEEKGAFIDSFSSGKRHVSRQSNIFAVLYSFADKEREAKIINNVLLSADIPPVTTPYFKLYEMMALCMTGHVSAAEDYISSYWGQMLSLGATSVWEQFDPNESGAQHYTMYGKKYDRSLCHAWGSGPILLLGRYVCGVRPTSPGGKTFAVQPDPGRYKSFAAVTPVAGGTVETSFENGVFSVFTALEGGTLTVCGKSFPIPAGKKISVDRNGKLIS